MPHVDELLFLVVEAENQRSEILARAFGLGVAADHAIDSLSYFDFEPVGAALLFVTTVAFFGEDAFEAFFFGDREQSGSLLSWIVLRITEDVPRQNNFF